MGIADLIRPKWKNSNPEIRLKAVKEMDISAKDRLEKIAANDTDSKVRMEAIKKISDEKVLLNLHDLAFGQSDSPVAEAAKDRLNKIYYDNILQTNDTGIQVTYLNKINDEKVLAALSCEIEDIEIRTIAVEKIYNPDLLCQVTENNCGLKIGMAIIDKLSETEHLVRISQNASNKKLKKHAQNKLDAIHEELNRPSPEEIKNTRMKEICEDIEKINISENRVEAEKLLSDIVSKWEALSPDDNHELSIRFKAARLGIEEKINILRKSEDIKENLESICSRAEKLSENISANTEKQITELEMQWAEQEKDLILETLRTGLQQRFDTACKIVLQKHEKNVQEIAAFQGKIEHLKSLCVQVLELAQNQEQCIDLQDADEKLNLLKQQWDKAFFEHSETKELQDSFDNAVNTFKENKKNFEQRRKQEQESQEKRLMELCEAAESAINEEDRSGLEQKIRAFQQEWKETGDLVPEIKESLFPRFRDACDNFFIKQREYWEHLEWERWANFNQKEELCKIVEHMAQIEEIEGIGKITREAQSKWKEIGPVSKDKSDEIWNRFNMACDKVFQRCLDHKKELYNQLTALLGTQTQDQDDINKSINWTETAEKIKEIQTGWNAIGTLPLALEKDLRQDFHELCNTFFENRRDFYQQRDEERMDNLKTKTALCEKAEAMSLSQDWSSTASKYKNMQRQWKETGPVPKNEGDELWQRFRSACNTFFDRMKSTEPENLRLKQQLCTQVEELLKENIEDTDMERKSRELIELQKQWKAIGPVPFDQAEDVWQRFHKPCDEFFEKRKEYLKQRDSQYEQNKVLKQELIAKAENLSESKEWKDTGEELKEIQKAWKEIGPCSHKEEQELWIKFRKACDYFFTSRKNFFDKLDNERMENLKNKETLCLSLEALARLVIPEKTLEAVDAVPSAEQLSIALDYKNEIIVPGNNKATWERAMQKVKDIQKQWKEIGPVPSEKDENLWKRFRSAGDIFFNVHSSDSGKDSTRPGNEKPAQEQENTK